MNTDVITTQIYNSLEVTLRAPEKRLTARRPVMARAVIVLVLIGAMSCAGERTERRPWAPADARMERLDDLHKPGIVEVGFWVSTVPEELVLAIRRHYAQEGWRERIAPEAFMWHESRGGGVLRVPGQPNPITIHWCGEWLNRAGDIVFYSVRAETDKPAPRAELHVYAQLRERQQYFEQCGGRQATRTGNLGGRVS